MKIYKIRAWTNKTGKRGRGKGIITHPYSFEEIIIDNLETAKSLFREQVSRIKEEMGNNKHVELFEPHIFEDGSLAYWPDNNSYIDKYETE